MAAFAAAKFFCAWASCPDATANASSFGFTIFDAFSFGDSYSKTLDFWNDSFKRNIKEIEKLNFDEKFIKIWEYYLTSCSSSFINQRTNVYQFTLQKN